MITWSDIKFPPINLYTVPILSVAVATTGCSSFDMNKIRDQRAGKGCYVIGAGIKSNFATAELQKNGLWCSDKLPKGYKFKFNNGIISAEVSDGK